MTRLLECDNCCMNAEKYVYKENEREKWHPCMPFQPDIKQVRMLYVGSINVNILLAFL